MNSFPEDDHPLINFLKQNRPPTPPASTDLEKQILALVETTPQEVAIAQPSQPKTHIYRRFGWFMTSAIAAGVVATVIGYRSFMPSSQLNESELVELQAFIESTWDGTVAEYPTTTSEELDLLTDEASLN